MLTVLVLMLFQMVAVTGISHWILFRGLRVKSQPLEFNVLFGLGVVGLLAHAFSLFAAIDWPFQVAIITAGISALFDRSFFEQYSVLRQRLLHQSVADRILIILLLVVVCLLAAGPIIRDDTESYHLQNILWIRSYGTVPGLANLHSRFGFNSIWFHTIATLVPKGDLNFYTTPNALLSMAVATYFLAPPIDLDGRPRASTALAYRMTFFIQMAIWYYWRGNIQSTNYDYFFTTATLLFFLHFANKKRTKEEWLPFAIGVPPILFCIRPLYAPTLLFTLIGLAILLKKKKKVKILWAVCGILAIITPFLYRNYLQSGYPLYPSPAFNIGEAVWSVPEEQVQRLYAYVRNYAITRNENPSVALSGWVSDLYTYDKLFVLVGLMGLLGYAVVRSARKDPSNLVWPTYFALQTGLWFWISPEPRFIAGIFSIGHFLFIDKLATSLPLKTIKTASFLLAGTMILFGAALISQKIRKESTQYANFLYPGKLPSPKTNTFTWEGLNIHVPERYNGNWNLRCFLTPLPCVYDSLPGVKMLGEKIENGFYVEKKYKRSIP